MVGAVSKGLFHLYYGDGKGKTSAAMGLAVRAAGNELKVLVVQFFKALPSGEVVVLEQLPGVKVLRGGASTKFVWSMNQEELAQCKAEQTAFMLDAWEIAAADEYDLLILDEGADVLHYGFFEEEMFLEMLAARPAKLEVVMTGHHLSEALEKAADYLTHMCKIKHPFDEGIKQRKGIEY